MKSEGKYKAKSQNYQYLWRETQQHKIFFSQQKIRLNPIFIRVDNSTRYWNLIKTNIKRMDLLLISFNHYAEKSEFILLQGWSLPVQVFSLQQLLVPLVWMHIKVKEFDA